MFAMVGMVTIADDRGRRFMGSVRMRCVRSSRTTSATCHGPRHWRLCTGWAMTTSSTRMVYHAVTLRRYATGHARPISGQLSIGRRYSNERLLAGVSRRIPFTTVEALRPARTRRRRGQSQRLPRPAGGGFFGPETPSGLQT